MLNFIFSKFVLFLILSASFTYSIKFTALVNLRCRSYAVWYSHSSMWEKDSLTPDDLLAYEGSTRNEKETRFYNLTSEDTWDEWLSNAFEIQIHISHNCSTNGVLQIRKLKRIPKFLLQDVKEEIINFEIDVTNSGEIVHHYR
ncbi:FTH domain-containing protein [Caenorhabditis elegans]|uniref:FTH domain-containing protein n=1 Tax=Caenorhabditis elegans TaxID=6239 RepID=C8JQQ3_CAEEL|nr:FTH domain-containing protein [Caenorhabditis elegans]CCD64946.1 FTH domain-containing protein [Caenorhabditis elegans]|eukprot:NP_001254062.1 Uncharacterized protein CELE_ZC239.22 [Caenorhabditis elegans]